MLGSVRPCHPHPTWSVRAWIGCRIRSGAGGAHFVPKLAEHSDSPLVQSRHWPASCRSCRCRRWPTSWQARPLRANAASSAASTSGRARRRRPGLAAAPDAARHRDGAAACPAIGAGAVRHRAARPRPVKALPDARCWTASELSTCRWAGRGRLRRGFSGDLGAEILKVEACAYADWWRGVDQPPRAPPPSGCTKRPGGSTR